jgi:hypothetical protein
MKLLANIKTLLNDFSKSQPALNVPGLPADKSGIKMGDLFDSAMASLKVTADATYDFALNGGAISTIKLGEVIPADAIVTAIYTQVKTTLDSATDTAEVEIKAGSTSLVAAQVITAITGVKAQALAAPVLLSADSELSIAVSVEALTAGVLRIMVEYITKE